MLHGAEQGTIFIFWRAVTMALIYARRTSLATERLWNRLVAGWGYIGESCRFEDALIGGDFIPLPNG
jgi:hypothetical protein